MNFLDLCSGIGGGRLGLEQCCFSCVGYSDTSRLAKITYDIMHNSQDEFFCSNIKKLNKLNTPPHGILIAGFPCQTFSIIGRKEEFDDTRGQIIFTLAKILSSAQPKYFILENVKGLVTHNKGQTFKKIVGELEKSGYKVFCKVLATLNYGIPQNRQRIYFVGIRDDVYYEDFQWPLESPLAYGIKDLFTKEKEKTPINHNYFKKYLVNKTNAGRYSLDDILDMNNTIIDT